VQGYGFADLERVIPVTQHTLFYIASTTKAFTALTLALMADRSVPHGDRVRSPKALRSGGRHERSGDRRRRDRVHRPVRIGCGRSWSRAAAR
jgi:hypothetical protein